MTKSIGKLLLTTTRQPLHAPILDGGMTTAMKVDGTEHRFGSLVVRYRRSGEAVVIGWRGNRVPNPQRWSPRRRLRIVLWFLRGQPSTELTPTQRDRFEAAAERGLAANRASPAGVEQGEN